MRRAGPNLLRWISIGLILISVGLFFYELVAYSRQRSRLPPSLSIAGVHVGGLDRNQALERLLQTYSTPIELYYEDQLILLSPGSVEFRIDIESIFAAAELYRTGDDFWQGFWDFLWGRPGEPVSIPLLAEYSRAQVEEALVDIALRYDEPPIPAQPIPGRPEFTSGEPGRVLDIPRASELVGGVLSTSTNRRIVLPVYRSSAPKPSIETLETLLMQILDVEGFNGLASFYVEDLRSGEVTQLSYFRNEEIDDEPGIVFTAGSTIKIAIAVAYFRYFDQPLDSEAEKLISEMLTLSGNDPADWLMERMDEEFGPLYVSETVWDLGFENSYIVAWYHPPPISLYGAVPITPGNQRTDINTNPDPLNQTTPKDLGTLLSDIYACSRGGGALLAAFPGEIREQDCSHILDLMAQNKIGVLIEAGVPEGTRVSHKHGWTDSPPDMISDVGIVFSPGGDYVISLFLWNEPEMIWEPASRLFATLSRAVYNYFNPL